MAGALDRELLDRLAGEAARRGPHSHGWAALLDDRWNVELGAGSLPSSPSWAVGPVVVGHSRLATSGGQPGSRPVSGEGQPLVTGNVLLAHNGVIPGVDTSEVDSLLLLRAVAAGEPLDLALRRLSAGSRAAAVLADIDSRTVTAVAAGQPLYLLERGSAVALCSRPFPGAAPVADVFRWSF